MGTSISTDLREFPLLVTFIKKVDSRLGTFEMSRTSRVVVPVCTLFVLSTVNSKFI